MGLFPFPTGGSLRGFGSRRRSFHRRHPRLRAAARTVATQTRRPDPSPAPLRSRRPRLPPGPPAPHVRCFSAAHRPTLKPALRARPLFFSFSRGPLLEWVNIFSGLFWSIFSSAARLINRNVTWHTRALSLLVTPLDGRPGGVVLPLSENPPQGPPVDPRRTPSAALWELVFLLSPIPRFIAGIMCPWSGHDGVPVSGPGYGRKRSVTGSY